VRKDRRNELPACSFSGLWGSKKCVPQGLEEKLKLKKKNVIKRVTSEPGTFVAPES